MKFNTIKYSELKEYRKKWHEEQGGICPLLKQKVPFEQTAIDHQHKRKDDPIGGANNLGLIRGVIHSQANSLEGKITNAYKRYGINKYIDLPGFLRNLADYLENPPLIDLQIVHPKDVQKAPKLGKREFNQLIKYYHILFPNRKKLPEYPKSGRMTKKLQRDFDVLVDFKDSGCMEPN